MSTPTTLESKDEIDKIAKYWLKESKALGKFPTPVDDIIQCARLNFDKNIDLSKVDSKFWTNKLSVLKSALSKVLGVAIPKKKIIYLDLNQLPGRQNFIKLHESGHHVLPWQSELYDAFEDDKFSLEDFVKETYEREASCFASSVLFQLDGFPKKQESYHYQ